MGKRTAQKDTITDITSDSQVNSNFPYRWSPASLTFNNYFYLFLYLYITRITIDNNAPHLKLPKNQDRRAALGRPAMKLLGAWTNLRSTNPRPWFYFSSPDKTTANNRLKEHLKKSFQWYVYKWYSNAEHMWIVQGPSGYSTHSVCRVKRR